MIYITTIEKENYGKSEEILYVGIEREEAVKIAIEECQSWHRGKTIVRSWNGTYSDSEMFFYEDLYRSLCQLTEECFTLEEWNNSFQEFISFNFSEYMLPLWLKQQYEEDAKQYYTREQ